MIRVLYNNENYEIEDEMDVESFAKNILKIGLDNILACKAHNEVKSLNFVMDRDCKLELIDYTMPDGNRIYVRGLTFIMLKAFEELYPKLKITINYSLGHSLYCSTIDGEKITEDMIRNVKQRMCEIVKKNIPFEKRILTFEEAKNLYEKCGRTDKIGLIENRMKSHVSMYYCGDTFNYFYGVMPMSTGYMKYFDIYTYEKGFLLAYPRRYNPTKIEKLKNTKKLYATFDEYERLHRVFGVENVVSLNQYIKQGKIGDLIRVTEALHEKKIANIADMIANDKKKRIVLVAGPSSSGKTTFAQRLGIELRINGINTLTLSMDNYFVNRKDNPKDKDGNYDFECLEAIDIALFNTQLKELLSGKEVKLPTFDFNTGIRSFLGNTAQIKENDVIVIEGIHGLNEELTKEIPRKNKFKIYISALTALNIDDYNRISTTDSRLLRRMLRDSKYRSHGVQDTIRMWPSVRNGEEKYIFPYQEEADVMFNSSLVYELPAIKTFVEPLLASVDHTAPEFSEAKRLYEFLGYFLPMEIDDIPKTSIIREFIGDGCFYR